MAEVIMALQNLLEVLFREFGAWNTVFILVGIYAAAFLWRWYSNYQREKDTGRAIRAMEGAVQRSAQEAREWRILYFSKEAGWSLEEAERIVSEGQFESPEEARKALEKKTKK